MRFVAAIAAAVLVAVQAASVNAADTLPSCGVSYSLLRHRCRLQARLSMLT